MISTNKFLEYITSRFNTSQSTWLWFSVEIFFIRSCSVVDLIGGNFSKNRICTQFIAKFLLFSVTQAQLLSPTHVVFHPSWSNGHAGCRADRPLGRFSRHYWEVNFLKERVFGTAMQVGLATASATLHTNRFLCNLLGQDEHSWGVSHKGLAWHGGESHKVCAAFPENKDTCLGLLFDGPAGTLSLYKVTTCSRHLKVLGKFEYHCQCSMIPLKCHLEWIVVRTANRDLHVP